MNLINIRDLQVGQRIRVDVGFGSEPYEGTVTQKGVTSRGNDIPDAIIFTLDDGTQKYAAGEVYVNVLDTK